MKRQLALCCRWADVVLVGVLINLAALLITPIARPELNLLKYSLSYYAVGPWAMVQTASFTAMGVASLTLGVAFLRIEPGSIWMALCAVMLLISGIASLGLVVFPLDSGGPATAIGDMHQTAGTIGGVAQLAAALTFVLAARSSKRWAGLFLPALAVFVVSLVAAMLSQLAIWRPDLGIPMGATMRLVVVPLILLWGAVALRSRQKCGAGIRRSSAAM